MSPFRRLGAALLPAVMLAACGRRIRPELLRQAALADLAGADSRALEGCYACLLDARDRYARLAAGPIGPLAASRQFEIELLIFLRERELAIDTGATLGRLRAAAAALSPDLDAPRLVRLVDLVPPNGAGMSDAGLLAFIGGHLSAERTFADDLRWFRALDLWPPVHEYIALSLECSDVGRPYRRPSEAFRPMAADPPLVAYRRALCGVGGSLSLLEHLQDASPAFVESGYFYARSVPTAAAKATSTRSRVAAAYAALPQSPAVTFLAGTSAQLTGNCREALRHYDETLVLQDHHESAQLGRTACLTYLQRPDEAIEAATRLIGWASTNLRDAYYWRAYNHRLQQHLDLARTDIDQSTRRGRTIENETLAGIIEYEQDDLDDARTDLDLAWSLSRGSSCTAAWYQGLVHIKRDDWGRAGAGFERAMNCYAHAVGEDRAGLAEMEARDDLDADFKAGQVANFKAAIAEDEHQQRASAMNAATSAANVADIPKARDLLQTAADDPALADAAASLRAFIAEHYPAAAPPR